MSDAARVAMIEAFEAFVHSPGADDIKRPSLYEARLLFEAGYRAALLAAGAVCEVVAADYPLDIWPDGTSVDRQSAKMARLTASNCGAAIRALLPVQGDAEGKRE